MPCRRLGAWGEGIWFPRRQVQGLRRDIIWESAGCLSRPSSRALRRSHGPAEAAAGGATQRFPPLTLRWQLHSRWGDIYSLKNVCDPTKKFRQYIATGNGRISRENRRCDYFHKKCEKLTNAMIRENYATLTSLIDVYFEFPPLGACSLRFSLLTACNFMFRL